ncbi:transmembrane and immunoglobulin domain-containing protein 2 isoform X2 [Otolemur garnettii]|uniref:transmembrane and immunoglobulin domain-containing protein 2 isoform X2 n=1 Tax=Otolemur garnettii TaxID=30611 RepID=UPI000C7F323E|nr:transmembrane and immunoglobulin domain-containing protein 2 isoform X2 [Otolemur garnettii]
MGSLGTTALCLLVQLWVLQGAISLGVQQEPKLLRVRQGTQATLACQVTQAQAWEQLRVGWTKDGNILCEPYITNDSLSMAACGPRGQLSWKAPGVLTLWLDLVNPSDSGDYVCWVVMEIPELDQADGNGTQLLVDTDDPTLDRNPTSSLPGLLFLLLMVGAVAVAAVVLGAGVWSCRRRWRKNSGNPLYSNVLHRPRGAPKKNEDWHGNGKVLDTPGGHQKGQSIYSISFPQPVSHQPCLAAKPCLSPQPSHYVSMVSVSPGLSPAGQPRPRGLPERRGVRDPGEPKGDTTTCDYVKIVTASKGGQQSHPDTPASFL